VEEELMCHFIDFKLDVLLYKALNGLFPQYLVDDH